MMLRGCLLILLLVTGCAGLPPLIAPDGLGQNVQVNQLVSLHGPQAEIQFNVVWSQKAAVFNLAGLSLAGQQLFRLQYRDGELNIHSLQAGIPEAQLEQLVRNIQWAYWPEDQVRQGLPKAWTLSVGREASRWRRIYHAGELHTEIIFLSDAPYASVNINQRERPPVVVTTLSAQLLSVAGPAVVGSATGALNE